VRNPHSFDVGFFLVAAPCFTLTFVILLPLWPQIRFKSAARSLTINAQGLTTSIGKILASRLWRDVQSVDERDGVVVITGKNRNALIVPARAFPNDDARREFREAARRWRADVNA
jgi:hypothetical protein